MKFIFVLFLILPFYTNTYDNLKETLDDSYFPGIQVFHFKTDTHFMFSSWDISIESGNLQGSVYLYMADKVKIPKGGVWAAVGLGSPNMNGSDMVICTYNPNDNNSHDCHDYYGEGHSPKLDTELGGTDDVRLFKKAQNFNLKKEDWAPYKKMVEWHFIKKMDHDDKKYDWKEIRSLMTNEGHIIAAYGDLSDKGEIQFHTNYSAGKLNDGHGHKKEEL